MCGITGFWLSHPTSSEVREVLGRMMAAIAHRGPDGQGMHIDERNGLALGHVRLAVIDLHTGDQPLHSRDRQISLTCNGELYDYKSIRADLIRRGHSLTTRADSEIAIPLYREHGLGFVEQLRGEFAFALFDADHQRLVLGRDRFGVRPLFVHIADNAIYWASEVKGLLAHPAIPGRLCRESALGQMMNLMVPGRSAFERIEQVLPGHMLIAERDNGGGLRVRQQRYWDLEFPESRAHEQPIDEAATAEALGTGLIESIHTRLEADVPVGCYLSGGIDSCSILALSDALQQSPVRAFTIGFDHTTYDESGPARRMAESVGAEQTILPLENSDLYGASYVAAVLHAERAFYNPFGVAKWHLSRTARQAGYRVVVTGEGADELFAGYPFFKQDLLRHGDGAASVGDMSGDARVFSGATITEEQVDHGALHDVCGFTPSWIQPWLLTLRQVQPLLTGDMRDVLDDHHPATALAGKLDPDALRGRHILDRAQYTYIKALLESQVLGWSGDRMDMAHALESRPAFLDRKLAELAVRIPPRYRIRDGAEKWILRQAMRHVLPDELYRRRKFAFMAPPGHVHERNRAMIESLVDTYLTPERIQALDFFDESRVTGFIGRWRSETVPSRARRHDAILNQLLGLHILHDELATA